MFENFSKTKAARKTFLFDSCRCFCGGIIEALFKNLALVIAIRIFHASKTAKSFLVSAGFIGYFITTVTQAFASKQIRLTTMDLCKRYMLTLALLIFASIFVRSLIVFLILIMLATMIFKQPVPLIEDAYGQNYSPQERGSRLAFVLMVIPLSAIMFALAGSYLMDLNLQNYKLILAVVSLSAVGSAMSFAKIPSRILPPRKGKSIFSNLKLIFQDKLFGMILLWWSFAGVATQMVNPLRTEFLINVIYGINASNKFETIACMAIPYTFRVLSSLLWGYFFDRAKLITVKLMVNLFAILGFLLFFHCKSRNFIVLASVFAGIAWGGGEIIWCLWVTKIAPKEHFSAYMSANVTIVGLRGLLAPFLGYGLSHYLTLQEISYVGSAFVLISSLGLFSLRKHPRFIRNNVQ
ncbi:MAG: MFS transporter [Puniceicoccales bacterium]|nr:MFS transporter [Puniceicoccales bacterium]